MLRGERGCYSREGGREYVGQGKGKRLWCGGRVGVLGKGIVALVRWKEMLMGKWNNVERCGDV